MPRDGVMMRPVGVRPHVVGLDMVRAVAILTVLLSHCGTIFAAWENRHLPIILAEAGFFGVELFFVLSGFLIGRLLIDILRDPPRFQGWLVFMMRRWMRTLPLYYLCLAGLAILLPPHFWEPGHAALWRDLPYYLTMTQNFAWPQVDGWFGVTWSLAVEEWFYLAFSALLFAAAALLGRKRALWTTLAIFIAVPIGLRALVPEAANWDEVTSKLVPLRFDAIAIGVAMAWLSANGRLLHAHAGALLAAGVLLIAFVWADGLRATLHMPQPVWKIVVFDIVSVAFALWLPAAAMLAGSWAWLDRLARALSAQSYALYLLHLEILNLVGYYKARFSLPPALCMGLVISACLGLSYLSYWYFERPLLARRPAQSAAHAAG